MHGKHCRQRTVLYKSYVQASKQARERAQEREIDHKTRTWTVSFLSQSRSSLRLSRPFPFTMLRVSAVVLLLLFAAVASADVAVDKCLERYPCSATCQAFAACYTAPS
jgi:CHASE1-domain containing sensor protein